MYTGEHGYLQLLRNVMALGESRDDRTGVGTRSIFGANITFDLREGFPLLTTKNIDLKSVSSELLWFIEGSGDERRLAELRYGKHRSVLRDKSTIWTANLNAPYWEQRKSELGWNDGEGDLGQVYGVNLRKWCNQYGETIDQLDDLITGLKLDPTSRRHLLTFWNPGELKYTALPACHLLSQYYVTNDGYLNCQWYQRSVDCFLGLPYNIASYALLTHMISHVVGLKPGSLTMLGGDVHIYENHIDAVREQLKREPKQSPTLIIGGGVEPEVLPQTMDGFIVGDFELQNYEPYPSIKAPMAV